MAITARDPKSIYADTTQELPTKFNGQNFDQVRNGTQPASRLRATRYLPVLCTGYVVSYEAGEAP